MSSVLIRTNVLVTNLYNTAGSIIEVNPKLTKDYTSLDDTMETEYSSNADRYLIEYCYLGVKVLALFNDQQFVYNPIYDTEIYQALLEADLDD